eukprot:RCo052981
MCGIVFLRLLKPPEYYAEKYGTSHYALKKIYLMMQKQFNRGQDGAGVANVKLNAPVGRRFVSRVRSVGPGATDKVFREIDDMMAKALESHPKKNTDVAWLQENVEFTGEVWLGHLRYGTYGGSNVDCCHPQMRSNNWKSRTVVLAGNFNLTNVEELLDNLVKIGQHPVEKSDTVILMEKISHCLDEENDSLFKSYKATGITNPQLSEIVARDIDVQKILQQAAVDWDGGYVIAGLIGNGDGFVMRDPCGIRPAFWYADDEVVCVCSERPPIQTAFNTPEDNIQEIMPGHALVVKRSGVMSQCLFRAASSRASCSFERIYFSRGSDSAIYMERKQLGRALIPSILKVVGSDLRDVVFSYIPNTAESAFMGLVEGLTEYLDEQKRKTILSMCQNGGLDEHSLAQVMAQKVRMEKVAVKDTKLRTFINEDSSRDELVGHVYDVTYGVVREHVDTLVVLDDSIVRGNTLKKSIISKLSGLQPKRIVVVSSAPQIRYPDCYGIDMAILGDFIAFQAAVQLLRNSGQAGLLDKVYQMAKQEELKPRALVRNVVKEIYKPFTSEQIAEEIARKSLSEEVTTEVKVIYQSIEGLASALPNHSGMWYFNGDYPTPGGNQVANRSFINYIEGRSQRAY